MDALAVDLLELLVRFFDAWEVLLSASESTPLFTIGSSCNDDDDADADADDEVLAVRCWVLNCQNFSEELL